MVSRVSSRLRRLDCQSVGDEDDSPKGCCCCSDERSFSLSVLTDKEYVERRNKSKKISILTDLDVVFLPFAKYPFDQHCFQVVVLISSHVFPRLFVFG